MAWGADAIYTITPDKKLTLDSYYKMPAPQTAKENCVAHNGSMIPVPGRNIEVQSWYQGGVSIMDYTDPTHPFEIGYFDRGPVDDSRAAMGGQWSTYYYNGYIYGSEIARGTDVFKLVPTKYLTQNEIDAAAQITLPELNVQDQPHIDYPMSFVTAKAYLDQLARGGSLTGRQDRRDQRRHRREKFQEAPCRCQVSQKGRCYRQNTGRRRPPPGAVEDTRQRWRNHGQRQRWHIHRQVRLLTNRRLRLLVLDLKHQESTPNPVPVSERQTGMGGA